MFGVNKGYDFWTLHPKRIIAPSRWGIPWVLGMFRMLVIGTTESAITDGAHITECLELIEASIGPNNIFRFNVIGEDYGVFVIAIFRKRSANCGCFFGDFDSVVAITCSNNVIVIRRCYRVVFDNDSVLTSF